MSDKQEALEDAAKLAESLVWTKEQLKGASSEDIQQSETAQEIANLIRAFAHREHLVEVVTNWGKCERYNYTVPKP